MKFDIKANHLNNIIALGLGALIILIVHPRGVPLAIQDFAPMLPQLLQWLNSLKAHSAESSTWVTPTQIIKIHEMAAERGLEAQAFVQQTTGLDLAALTGKQASQVIDTYLKPLPKMNLEEGGEDGPR
jgi:hypothetical protein